MRKLLAIILAVIMATVFTLPAGLSAHAYNACECGCDDCTGDDDCECYCGECDYCDPSEEEEENEEDEEDEEDEENDEEEESGKSDEEGKDPSESDTKYTEAEKSQDLANIFAYQYCGDSMFWYLRSNTLYIFGRDRMYEYESYSKTPWANKSFDEVVIRGNVRSVSANAFRGSQIVSVKLTSTIEKIGDYAFAECKKLKSAALGKGMNELGSYAFYNCTSLKTVTINNNLKLMGVSAFENCTSLEAVRFPSTLHVIESRAFKGCTSLKKITLRTGLITVKDEAFCNCSSLSAVNFTDTITDIGIKAFYSCSRLKRAKLGDNLNTVGAQAFAYSGVESAEIRQGVKKLDATVFSGCYGVEINVYQNAYAYKMLYGKYGLNVVCAKHECESVTAVRASFSNDGVTGGSKCKACGATLTSKTVARLHSVTLSKTTFTYNGKTQIPKITVKDANSKTVSQKNNYKLTPSAGCCNVGTYSIKIDFIGSYTGSKTYTFTIIPKAASISKLTPQSKAVKIDLNKQTTQTTGYEIQYATASSFSSAKTVTISKNTTASYTLKKLTAKKKYYFRARSYKTVNGKKIYSAWSKTKSTTTKK